MNNIKILDCSLRDGGYNNNWQFSSQEISTIVQSLVKSNIDYIEVGYITNKNVDMPSTLFNSFSDLDYLSSIKTDKMLFCMINMFEYKIDDIPNSSLTSIDGIRIAFHKENYSDAVDFANQLILKDYKVILQPMIITRYSQPELLNLIDVCNKLDIFALYIVDSFGALRDNDIKTLSAMFDLNVNSNIQIGLHAHNNMNNALSNAKTFIDCIKNHSIIVDSSILGIGRCAGNVPTSLIQDYLNKQFNYQYFPQELLQVEQNEINSIYNSNPWGYDRIYELSANLNCNPMYAKYLFFENSYDYETTTMYLKQISEQKKVSFDINYIKDLITK